MGKKIIKSIILFISYLIVLYIGVVIGATIQEKESQKKILLEKNKSNYRFD